MRTKISSKPSPKKIGKVRSSRPSQKPNLKGSSRNHYETGKLVDIFFLIGTARVTQELR